MIKELKVILNRSMLSNMEKSVSKKEIKKLVARGQKEEALKELMKFADSQDAEVSNQIYSLSANFESFKKKKNYGVLSPETEKQLANELTFRFLMITDQLDINTTRNKKGSVQPKDEPSSTYKAPPKSATLQNLQSEPKRERSGKIAKWKLLIPGIIAVLLLVFLYFGNSTATVNTDAWTGTWEQSLFPDDDKTLVTKGTLTFEIIDGKMTGTAILLYPFGSKSSTNQLFDITFKENGALISGKWRSSSVKEAGKLVEGTFRFRLEKGSNSFNGKYTYPSRKDKVYHWNGIRKETQ